MRDLDDQMTSLDDFVTRARSQNAQHDEQHTQSMHSLSSTVEDSYAKIGEHFKTTCSRVEEMGSEMDTDIGAADGTLEPLLDTVRQPLANLREDISNTVIQEYQPTGETPQKITYEYPTELPRTKPHSSLIAKFNGEPSPSKKAVFVDADPTLLQNRSPSRPVSNNDDGASAAPGDRSRNPLMESLRELHPNVNSNSAVDQRTSTSLHGFGSSGAGVEDDMLEDVTMPLLKKSRTTTTRGRPNKRTLNAEDRENLLPPLATIVPGGGKEIFSQSITRRKSPRLN